MYKIERFALTWIGLTNEYSDFESALKALNSKKNEYPNAIYRLIKFEVIEGK